MIKKIVIEIAGQEIEMDLAEAKRVKSVLEGLFKKEYVSIPAPYPVIQRDYPRFPTIGDITYAYSDSKNHL